MERSCNIKDKQSNFKTGKEMEENYFQRMLTNRQQIYEKVFNIINQQR